MAQEQGDYEQALILSWLVILNLERTCFLDSLGKNYIPLIYLGILANASLKKER